MNSGEVLAITTSSISTKENWNEVNDTTWKTIKNVEKVLSPKRERIREKAKDKMAKQLKETIKVNKNVGLAKSFLLSLNWKWVFKEKIENNRFFQAYNKIYDKYDWIDTIIDEESVYNDVRIILIDLVNWVYDQDLKKLYDWKDFEKLSSVFMEDLLNLHISIHYILKEWVESEKQDILLWLKSLLTHPKKFYKDLGKYFDSHIKEISEWKSSYEVVINKKTKKI